MKYIVALLFAALANGAVQDGSSIHQKKLMAASCTTDVTGYLMAPDPNHWVVPVGVEFEATFSFTSTAPSWVVTEGYQHFAPGTTTSPEVGSTIRQESFQFTATYLCENSIGHTPKDAPATFRAQHLKFEYGTAFPDSAACDTQFECCDVGCHFKIDESLMIADIEVTTNSRGEKETVARTKDGDIVDVPKGLRIPSWGGAPCDEGADVCVPCGGEFRGEVMIEADCPDARVTLEAVETSGVTEFRPSVPAEGLRDWDSVQFTYQCPEKRGSSHFLKFRVSDQYGGEDTCEFEFQCQWCPQPFTCPMCAPDQKEWICYNDRAGDFNLVAITEDDLKRLDPSAYVYPTEYYPGFEDDAGVQLDCWCDPICEMPPDGLTFVCHDDGRGAGRQLAAVHTEDRVGPMNDLNDYLEAGDGFPGTHIDGDFHDCWCHVLG